jgi:hypothetical protein
LIDLDFIDCFVNNHCITSSTQTRYFSAIIQNTYIVITFKTSHIEHKIFQIDPLQINAANQMKRKRDLVKENKQTL